jgi:hypothetical protein
MPDKDYSQRDVLDKLGIKPGQAVALALDVGGADAALARRILERTGRSPADNGEVVDVLLARVGDATMALAVLQSWRARLQPAGAIWLLTAKRGQPGYLDQRELIAAGQRAGLVDNKSCSVSDGTSGLRFVIRREHRQARGPSVAPNGS